MNTKNNKAILLSYPLNSETPLYGGKGKVDLSVDQSISSGNSCNSIKLVISNHSGTHVDCPYHFDNEGKRLTDYVPEDWIFNSVPCFFTRKSPDPGSLITPELIDWFYSDEVYSQAEMVVLKTGWCGKRLEPVYHQSPPGIDTSLVHFLRDRFPKITMFGFDLISAGSFVRRDQGKIVHRAFLKEKKPIRILEDMDLSQLLPGIGDRTILNTIIVSPLLLDGADGAPCTVWAMI